MTGFICRRIGTKDIGMYKTQGVSDKLTKCEVLLKEHFGWSWLVGWLVGLSFSTLTFAKKYSMDLTFICGSRPLA